MSGGMDIDWNYRDKLFVRANEKFGHWSRDEIIKYSDWLAIQILNVEQEEKRLHLVRQQFNTEQDEIHTFLKEYK